MLKQVLFWCVFVLFFALFYSLVYINFLDSRNSWEYPQLRARLGTILYHPEHQTPATNFDYHSYCYYPSSQVSYPDKSGEYIIKRVQSIEDCQGWFGVMSIPEGKWVSEREKLWWLSSQKPVT